MFYIVYNNYIKIIAMQNRTNNDLFIEVIMTQWE